MLAETMICDKATFQRYAIGEPHCKPQQCKPILFTETDLKNIVSSHVLMNSANKQDKQYNSLFSDSAKAGHKTSKSISKNKRRKNRRNTSEKRRAAKESRGIE